MVETTKDNAVTAGQGDDAVTQAKETIQVADTQDTISRLAAMNDEELAQVLGMTQKFQDTKAQIQTLNGIKGEGRKYAEQRISEMLTPRVYDLDYIVEAAQRKNSKKDAKAALNDCSPCSVLD